jgi:septal ring factor EnvC (AmiA/AmiB activator)
MASPLLMLVQELSEREAQLVRWEGELRGKEADLASRGREMGELRAHLAEEKGNVESIRREMAHTEARAAKEVSAARAFVSCVHRHHASTHCVRTQPSGLVHISAWNVLPLEAHQFKHTIVAIC